MQKVMCEHCKQEVPVMLYFYDARIIKPKDINLSTAKNVAQE